jgi:type VI protein secretion system component Hcp
MDGIPFEFARWSFEGARIASFVTTSSDQDQFALVYDRLQYSYTPLTAAGAPGTPVVGAWDVASTGGMVLPALPNSAPLAPRTATIDYFVYIPGIEGDSQRVGYAGWIEASSFEFALRGADPQAGSPAFATTFDVIAAAGRASPRLLSAVASGEVFSSPIEIAVVGQFKGGALELARWTFESASIAAYATASGLLEGFSIAFDTLHYAYADLEAGGAPLPPAIASWDLVAEGVVLVNGDIELDPVDASAASVQIFARVPGAAGDSQTVGYVGWIPVDEFGFRMERPLPGGGAPHGTSFAFAVPTGKSSPKLFELVAHGTPLSGPVEIALIAATKRGPREFARWTLDTAHLGNFATSSAALDSFTAGFDELTYAYTPLAASGQASPPVAGSWDVSATGSSLTDAPLELPTSPVAQGVSLLVAIPGIPGPSTLAGYVGWLPVKTFDFALTGPLASSGTAVARTFRFDALSSKASPELLRAIASGQSFAGAEVVAVRTIGGSKVQEFARWSLTNVQVVAYATENVLADSFGLSFDALNYAFAAAETKTKTPPVTASWNRLAAGGQMVSAELGMPQSIAPADVRTLLQIPGIQGSSQLVGYVDWIELTSARLAADRLVGSDLSFVTSFQLVAHSSPGSAQLLQAVAQGRIFSGAETVLIVTVRIPKGGAAQELARWTLRDATLTSYATASAWQDGFSLGFRELQLDYTPFSAKGLPAPTIQVPWNLAATGTQLVDRGAPSLEQLAPPTDVLLLLRIPGIEGDSQRVGYVGWIPIDTFGFTLSRPWDSGEDAAASALVFTLPAGLASPRLLEGAAHGIDIPSVELVAITNKLNIEFARLELAGVTLVAVQTADSAHDGLALTFESLVFRYREFDEMGSPTMFIVGTWSVAGSTPSEPPSETVASIAAPPAEPDELLDPSAIWLVDVVPHAFFPQPRASIPDAQSLDQLMAEFGEITKRVASSTQVNRLFDFLDGPIDDSFLEPPYMSLEDALVDGLLGRAELNDFDVATILPDWP